MRKKRPFRDRFLLPAFLLVFMVFGVLAAHKYLVSRTPPQQPAQVSAEPRQVREVTLYFGAPDGTYLLSETREVENCRPDETCLEAVVDAVVQGPVGDLVPILPPHAALLGATIDSGTAVLDFSQELVSAHPGGSISELLTVYGLADTIAVNFPHLRQVRILVEGQTVETLKGHMSLKEQITADFTFTKPPETIVPTGTAPEKAPAAGAQEEKEI